MEKQKDHRKIKRIIKGFANNWRIRTMALLKETRLSVGEISENLKTDFKNISIHITKLAIAGIVIKRYQGREVHLKLTARGENILTFIRMLE
ncbi:MAG: winged helix-turn-helix domain-containing protein [Candidatus Pacebacteria bacterium]|jgi:DNA-binding transcriptional ArsR family regulator|nr:winged helix-turn-helix domain-containing protein [Candidatus Paceibacterota bacterium]